MYHHSKLSAFGRVSGLAFGLVLASASLARADRIVALVDEHGHKVYVNVSDSAALNAANPGGFQSLRAHFSPVPPEEINRLVQQTADRFQVDPKLVHAIIQVESDYNPAAVSNKGAMGLMQLVPATAHRYGVSNPFDPKQNIEGGVNHLKYLLDLFKGDLSLSLAAYNAGENSVLRRGGVPDFQETRAYIKKVSGLYGVSPVPDSSEKKPAQPPRSQIYRYVDANGVMHFTDGTEF
ncbi:MAG: transglycosylase SLT domain-containing protein [Terriglobia bacterium]